MTNLALSSTKANSISFSSSHSLQIWNGVNGDEAWKDLKNLHSSIGINSLRWLFRSWARGCGRRRGLDLQSFSDQTQPYISAVPVRPSRLTGAAGFER